MDFIFTIIYLVASILNHSSDVSLEDLKENSLYTFQYVLEVAQEVSEPEISINFTGDILLDSTVGHNIDKYGVDYPFEHVSPILQDADITIGNLETPITTRGEKVEKIFNFRSKPKTLEGLINAGFDGVGIANNHILDYGHTGLKDTLYYLKEYGLDYSGAGMNEKDAYKPIVKEVDGKEVAILALNRVYPYTDWRATESRPGTTSAYHMEPMMSYVKETVERYDYTIIYIHWNKEYRDYPEDYARVMAKNFIDSGVDAVIGHHSHSLMGIEFYKNKPIYYSLGNFVFTQPRELKGQQTMIVHLTLKGDDIYTKITPARILNTQPTLMDEEYNQNLIDKLNNLSYNAIIDNEGNVKEIQN